MTLRHLNKFIHKALTGFMAVWLSGVLFLLCCQTMNAKAIAADSCPLAKKSDHCDKAKKANQNAPVIEFKGGSRVECCSFLHAVFDKARKIEQSQKQIAVTTKVVPFRFAPPRPANNSRTITTFHSRFSDRRGTFIRNCVFRI